MNGLRKTFAIAAAVSLVCLSSVGAMAANKLIVRNAGNTADAMVVTDSGFIGIGMTPSVAFSATGPNAAYAQFLSWFNAVNPNGGGGFACLHNNGSTAALPLAGDRVGYYLFGTQDGATRRYGAGITVKAAGAWTTADQPAYMLFQTGTGNLERMRITTTGFVGIGTPTPAQRLDVIGGIRIGTTSTPAAGACTAATRGSLWFANGATTDVLYICAQASGTPIWRTVTLQ